VDGHQPDPVDIPRSTEERRQALAQRPDLRGHFITGAGCVAVAALVVPPTADREVSLKRPLVTIDPDLVHSHPRLVSQLVEGRQVLAKADPQHPRAELAAAGEPKREARATPRRLRQ
jgi:hypothetical protein